VILTIMADALAFISIRAKPKFHCLVNVSGFMSIRAFADN